MRVAPGEGRSVREVRKICNCRKELNKRLSEFLKVQGEIVDYEMLSSRTFSTFKYQEGKKKKEQLLLHSHCPFCGEAYVKEATT